MGILTGKAILEEVKSGNIEIDPFDFSKINPNSYNLTLADTLKVYDLNYETYNHMTGEREYSVMLDAHKNNHAQIITIPEEGMILRPGILYLGRTVERTHTDKYVPMLNGRSSIGRLGMCIHLTAGFGDIGFDGTWTLEITVVHPLRIYPNMEICQIYFETPVGDPSYLYNGRYNHQFEVTESRVEQEKKGVFQG